MTTHSDNSAVSPPQCVAATALATGASVTAAATAVGVTRQTVSGWLHHDRAFQADLNRRRAEVWQESVDRLRGLLPRAVDTLGKALDDGDVHAALGLLKLAGLRDAPSRIGPTTTTLARAQAVQARLDRELRVLAG